MHLTWYGHAAFEIETKGTRILTDPYSSQIGYAPLNVAPNLVTLSHENPKYHSCLTELQGGFATLDGLQLAQEERTLGEGRTLEEECTVEINGVRFGAVEVFEDAAGNGPNAMVWLEAEGLRVLHMGDCGHPLTAGQLRSCGEVDVLLAPAGGSPTLDVADLARFVRDLRPRLVVPMHYALPQLQTLSLRPVEEFTRLFPATQVRHTLGSTIDVRAELGAHPFQVLIMPPAR